MESSSGAVLYAMPSALISISYQKNKHHNLQPKPWRNSYFAFVSTYLSLLEHCVDSDQKGVRWVCHRSFCPRPSGSHRLEPCSAWAAWAWIAIWVWWAGSHSFLLAIQCFWLGRFVLWHWWCFGSRYSFQHLQCKEYPINLKSDLMEWQLVRRPRVWPWWWPFELGALGWLIILHLNWFSMWAWWGEICSNYIELLRPLAVMMCSMKSSAPFAFAGWIRSLVLELNSSSENSALACAMINYKPIDCHRRIPIYFYQFHLDSHLPSDVIIWIVHISPHGVFVCKLFADIHSPRLIILSRSGCVWRLHKLTKILILGEEMCMHLWTWRLLRASWWISANNSIETCIRILICIVIVFFY